MLKTLMTLTITAFLTIGSAHANPVDNLTFYTEDSPPLNFMDGSLKGITVDILKEIFKRTGSVKKIGDIKLVPWARGYDALNTGPNVILFSTAKTKERTPLFKWVGPITDLNIGIFTTKGGPSISKASDLMSLKIGSVQKDVGEQILLSETSYPEASLKRSSLSSGIKKLKAGRIDAFAYMELPARYKIGQLGFKQSDFVLAYELLKLPLYYSASKDVSDEAISMMQKALDEIRSDGTLDKIIASYL
ncbi:MAG: transporter substrate-binding domain-containing protein [Sneathiella sp.]